MRNLSVKIGALVLALVGLGACGGSPAAPTGGLTISGLDIAQGGSPGDYSYSVDLRITNTSTTSITITRLDVVVAKSGSAFYNFSIGPSPTAGLVQPNKQVLWGPVNATHVSALGDSMTLTVTYHDASGIDKQVTKTTPLGS